MTTSSRDAMNPAIGRFLVRRSNRMESSNWFAVSGQTQLLRLWRASFGNDGRGAGRGGLVVFVTGEDTLTKGVRRNSVLLVSFDAIP